MTTNVLEKVNVLIKTAQDCLAKYGKHDYEFIKAKFYAYKFVLETIRDCEFNDPYYLAHVVLYLETLTRDTE